jgi:hypothetical protein
MIQRYEMYDDHLEGSPIGEWVKFEDVIKLLNEVAFSSSDVEYKNIQGYYLSLERLRDLLTKE